MDNLQVAGARNNCREWQTLSVRGATCPCGASQESVSPKASTLSHDVSQRASVGRWIDSNACSAICILVLNDKRDGVNSTPTCSPRPKLPSCIYTEHVASFLRFVAPLPNMLYAIGGRNRRSGPVDAVEMLDTWHGTWLTCVPMPRRRAGCAAAALPDGRLLVVGGYDERGIAQGLVASCDMYDPFLEAWSQRGAASLHRARWGHGCVLLGGRVYVVGGCSLQSEARPQEVLMETLRSCEVYDASLDRWDLSAPLQIARSGCRVVAIGGQRLAAVGGCDDVFGRAETQATVEIFDEASGHWDLLHSRLVRPRTSAAVAVIDEKRLFVAGGAPSQLSVEIYGIPAVQRPRLISDRCRLKFWSAADEGEIPAEVNAGSMSQTHTVAAEETWDAAPWQRNDEASKPSDGQEIADMLEGRMGCHAAVVRLPSAGNAFPVCDTECVLVVGGEHSDASARVRQLCSVAAYDLTAGAWRKEAVVPPMTVPRTAAALCLGLGRVSCARLPGCC
eukprot:TRINITY_DN22480_c0_g1_i1.p1 TRINITY_DN22480_c0_g1~~TRINITY_DN22480_c0_g1_i1.p1  ORF type:complete len:505 (+),score=72.40 TRINITY_DN22480_c0_g1_i1:87-1601(+)